jgi:membrane protease YdiL (CAAX protease family)
MFRSYFAKSWRVWLAIALPLWVLISFYGAMAIIQGVLWLIVTAGLSFEGVNRSVVETAIAGTVYVLAFAITVGVPWLAYRRQTSRKTLGLEGVPSWKDLGLAPLGFILYLIASSVVVYVISLLVPWLDLSQTQEVGFADLSQRFEYFLAFLALVVIAPIAEEALFRGYLYGKLRNTVPVWIAILIVSAVFAVIHGQWNVGIDVFVLSIVACLLREVTGSIWAGILLHMLKNGLAFYLLFINGTYLVK